MNPSMKTADRAVLYATCSRACIHKTTTDKECKLIIMWWSMAGGDDGCHFNVT